MSQNGKVRPAAKTLNLYFGDRPISTQLKEYIQARIKKEVPCAFSRHDLDVGSDSAFTYCIELEPHVPFKERTRRVSLADLNDLKRCLQDLLAVGILAESHSPYASSLFLSEKRMEIC